MEHLCDSPACTGGDQCLERAFVKAGFEHRAFEHRASMIKLNDLWRSP